jgi:hypothetical protein
MPSRRRFETKRDPIREALAGRAYEIFLEHGAHHGSDLDDWLQAERELVAAVTQRNRDIEAKSSVMTNRR